MRLAIATFGKRIAPRFDHAPEMLLIDDFNENEQHEETINVTSLTEVEKIYFLMKREVEILLCGGIDRKSARLLRAYGITIYAWLNGEPESAIKKYLDGVLTPDFGVGNKQQLSWQNRHGYGHQYSM